MAATLEGGFPPPDCRGDGGVDMGRPPVFTLQVTCLAPAGGASFKHVFTQKDQTP